MPIHIVHYEPAAARAGDGVRVGGDRQRTVGGFIIPAAARVSGGVVS